MKLLSKLLTSSFLGFLCVFFSTEAMAYPEMIGHGYQSCRACHYDSTGGGPLTEYGRTIAEELLSTWSRPNEGETFYGWVNLKPFGLAGDFRSLYSRYEDDHIKVTQSFPMQREMSLTFDPSKNVSFVGSAGYYGPDAKELEYRRYYGKITMAQGLWMRGGRFMPAFGILIPDHTKATRELFSQGQETLNLEFGITTKYFELIGTRIAGAASDVRTTSRPSVIQRDDRDGYAGKLSIFLHRGIQIGGSYLTLTSSDGIIKNYSSGHFYLGGRHLWFYGEVQSWPDSQLKRYGTIGCSPIKGLWMKTEYTQSGDNEGETFGTLDWFPRPHFQLTGSASKKQFFLVSHLYL